MDPDHSRHVQIPAPPPRVKKQRPVLRTHKRAFLLLAFYIAIVLIPWIVTAMLSRRPLTKPSWTYAPGISYKDYKVMQGWARAIPILNAIAAILAIPILSSIIAQAAVVFAQRRHPGQHLSVRQLFKLADRSWGDLATLNKMLWWNEPGHASVNWFLIKGMVLVFLGAVQFPLYQLLAPWKELTMPTCRDTQYIDYGTGRRSCDFDSLKFPDLGYTPIGIDLEPAQMAVVPQRFILPQIISDLASLTAGKAHPYIWQSPDTAITFDGPDGFAAALVSKTTTGVLREHIMRLNSTASCVSRAVSEFPASCAGANPFQTRLQYKGAYDWGQADADTATVDICAPGDLGKHPWTLSRNRQDLTEEVFLKFEDGALEDTVLHCTGQTTRGYFELGNVYNGDVFGGLLEEWPRSGEELDVFQFNDFMGREYGGVPGTKRQDGYLPSEEDTNRGGATPIPDPRTWRDYNASSDSYPPQSYTNTSGPLMLSMLSLFGPSSWTASLSNLTSSRPESRSDLQTTYSPALLAPLCSTQPFNLLSSYTLGNTYGHQNCADSLLDTMATYTDHLDRWRLNDTAGARIAAAMQLANVAALTVHTAGVLPWAADTGREIYSAPGIRVAAPSISLPALIILSVIVGVQVLALLALGVWIALHPTWTRTLDALAVARVAGCVDGGVMPGFRTVGDEDWVALGGVDGLVGVREGEQRGGRVRGELRGAERGEAEIEMRALSVASTVGKDPGAAVAAEARGVELGLGAPGVVGRRWGRRAERAEEVERV